jgi:FMN phosphatase YigB (HAD superfamily)
MSIKTLLFDFDGTLTAVDRIIPDFLAAYRSTFLEKTGISASIWDETLAAVQSGSPGLGWMLCSYEACPADADPYILASETALRTLASCGMVGSHAELPGKLYGSLYAEHQAPFRPETAEVLTKLVESGYLLRVVSNASTGKVEERLKKELPAGICSEIPVFGDATKFLVCPASLQSPERARFDALPMHIPGPGRPVWLKRGKFFDALQRAKGNVLPEDTLFIGDIYELDLVLPKALGYRTLLIERKAPLGTHAYEREVTGEAFIEDLSGIWEWLD